MGHLNIFISPNMRKNPIFKLVMKVMGVSSPNGECVTTQKIEIASPLTLLAMTEKPLMLSLRATVGSAAI
jgi:hypothetical protein